MPVCGLPSGWPWRRGSEVGTSRPRVPRSPLQSQPRFFKNYSSPVNAQQVFEKNTKGFRTEPSTRHFQVCIRSVNRAEGQCCSELSLGGWPRRYCISHRCSWQTKHSRGRPPQHPVGGNMPVVIPRRVQIVPCCFPMRFLIWIFPAVICIYAYTLLWWEPEKP